MSLSVGFCLWYPPLWHSKWRSLRTSEMLTLTKRPPSSTPRKRNWVFRARRSCSWTSCCPSRRSAAPDRESQCTWTPASASVSCSVCPTAAWGWFCVKTRRPRSETESVASPGRWPGLAGSAAPRTIGCCSDLPFCPAWLDPGCSRCCPRWIFYCASSSSRSASAVCPAPPHWSPDYPQGRPGNWSPLPFLFWRNARRERRTRCPP